MNKIDLEMLQYYWEEKGDYTRYVNYNKIKHELARRFPEVAKAIAEYESSIKILSMTLRDAVEKME